MLTEAVKAAVIVMLLEPFLVPASTWFEEARPCGTAPCWLARAAH